MKPLVAVNEHDLYPIHEEDSVPQGDPHYWQVHYLGGALDAFRPDLRVTCDLCHYWEPGNTSLYVALDLSVIAGPTPPSPRPNVYLKWRDPPMLFVAEVRSPSNTEAKVREKQRTYAQNLEVPEFLHADPSQRRLSLQRLIEGSYHEAPPDASGRVWSAQLGVWFGYDDASFLRIYTRDGEMLLTQEEKQRADAAEQRATAEAEQRAEAERQLAELRAELERLRGGPIDQA